MKITSKLAIVTAFAALAACGGTEANNTDANMTADMNAGMTDMNADMNAGMTDMNAMDLNATTDLNATGNVDANAAANTTNSY